MSLHRRHTFTGCLVALLVLAHSSVHADSIWIEGEDATQKSVTKHGWYDDVRKDGMSGSEWLSHYDGGKPGTATYQFTVERGGEHTFWWRGNTALSKVSYKLNDGEFQPLDMSDKRGEFMVSQRPDHRSLAWVKVGRVNLQAGENTLTIRFESRVANHGGTDVVLFDDSGFVPSGTTKPEVASVQLAGPDEAIWLEGEAADQKAVTKHGWYDSVKKDGMSGGEWLSHYDADKPGTATYDFSVTKADDYVFWWRGNTAISQASFRIDDGEFRPIPFDEKRGEFMISERPDHRSLAWVKVGIVPLSQGEHTLTVKFHSKLANHGGVDAMCLVRIPFVPSGGTKPSKPGTAKPAGPADWFPVVFDTDRFSPESVIDQSAEIEAPAGKHGFVTRNGDVLQFSESKKPIAFWGCGANAGARDLSREQQTARIRYLRKHGVNMVRQHTVMSELGSFVDGKFDAQRLDDFDWYFAELKKHGIYMTWSMFYPLTIHERDGYDPELFAELESAGGDGKRTYGIVNVEPKLQELQWVRVKALLLHRNPYTGLRYIDDPALAVVETHNEDTVFFHTPLNDLHQGKKWPKHSQRLRKRWFEWVKARYGTEDAVKQAWGNLRRKDDWAGGELELMGAFHFGGQGPLYEFQGQTKRAGDLIEFLAELQRDFYERREQQLRELGYKAITVTTAWRAGGPAADPANLWCDTAADMIDRHNYFGGGAGGHSISLGKVNNQTHLSTPGGGLLSMGLYQVKDRPFSTTEWTQLPPNQYKLEAAPLIAFYGMGLQGWDASYHFTSSRAYPGDGWPNLSSYVTDTPHYIGQFPALSYAIRHGHLKQGPIVADRHVSEKQMFSGTDPLKQDFGGGHDVKVVQDGSGTPSAALAVGRVTVAFDDQPSKSEDLAPFINTQQKVVRSATGELTWDYGRQRLLVQSPKTQAVIGRTDGDSITLPSVELTVKTPFVSLIFTPLDNKPLAESKQILITAMARDKQTGTEYNADGTELVAIGGPPLLMEPVQAEIKIAGAPAKDIRVLDVYGVPTGESVPSKAGGKFTIDGRYRTYYYEVIR